MLASRGNVVTSGRQGSQQYELGKQRLLQWFDQFEHYGFSEWNSTTYLPIDLIGFSAFIRMRQMKR